MVFFLILEVYLALSKDLFTCSDTLCSSDWIGDGICDPECMLPGCNFDSSFPGNNFYEAFLISDCFNQCYCSQEMLTNNKCDPLCNNYQCGWDLGDCGYCASGCFESDLIGSECKDTCKTIECLFNNNNCGWCNEGCYNEDLVSDTCKEECKHSNCDSFLTNPCSGGMCAKGCSLKMIKDGKCDSECYNKECYYDDGDCNCNKDCKDTSQECWTDEWWTDPCDNKECGYKDGKCGFCASGCFENDLGDGTCQDECNNSECGYDFGDCGCSPGCSFIYDPLLLNFTQAGDSDECSVKCLVPECHFAVDFCGDKDIIKKGILNYVVYQNSSSLLDLDKCNCSSNLIEGYLDGVEFCQSNSECYNQECLYCLGMADYEFSNCVRNNFDKCLICKNLMVEGTCQDSIKECPEGYEQKKELSEIFENEVWCLKKAFHYSKSNYNKVFVDSSAKDTGSGSKDDPFQTLYNALIRVHASFTKIYLKNQEIDFYDDGSTSIFILDKDDPLNSDSKYTTYELWIIGSFSESIKTKVYWKDNLRLTPHSEKFYLKNLEFIGTNVLKNDCESEFCAYCPYLSVLRGNYFDDRNDHIEKNTISSNYSTTCSSFSLVNILDFTREVYIESVDFKNFRYQYNSFIRSSGVLSLVNVNFYKMQAKESGSVILLNCTNQCIEATFNYKLGRVSDLGAGYDDTANVATGSFIKSLGIGFISISQVEFTYNLILVNQKSANKAYLLYSLNHLGTISISDCFITNNYLNYLLYIDASSLTYADYRYHLGKSLSYSQEHLSISNVTINSTYTSESIIYYLTDKVVHNIKLKNLAINNSVIGGSGIISLINKGALTDSVINGVSKQKIIENERKKIYLAPNFIFLESITIKNSCTGKNAIFIAKLSNIQIINVLVDNIKDCSVYSIKGLIDNFKKNDTERYFSNIDSKNEVPDLNCNEMIHITNSVNLYFDSVNVSKISCRHEAENLAISLQSSKGSIIIYNLYLIDIESSVSSGLALTANFLDSIFISNVYIQNVKNLQGSIVQFSSCGVITIDVATIYLVSSEFSGTLFVYNSTSFTLKNFNFLQSSNQQSNGGCIHFLTGQSGSTYNLQSGSLIECSALNGNGGSIFLDSTSKELKSSINLDDVEINNCLALEGSAIFISRTTNLNFEKESKFIKLKVTKNKSQAGATITDYHFSGTLKLEKVEMSKNTGIYAGIYVFYSTNKSSLVIENSKFFSSDSKDSLIYFESAILKSLIFIRNTEISHTRDVCLRANNVIIESVNLSFYEIDFPIILKNQVLFNASGLSIMNSYFTAIGLTVNSTLVCRYCLFKYNKDLIIDEKSFSNFTFNDSRFNSNTQSNEHLFKIDPQAKEIINSFTNCDISYNMVSKGSIIFSFSGHTIIRNCSIKYNSSLFSSTYDYSLKLIAIYSAFSKVSVYNTVLDYSVDYGYQILADFFSDVLIENSFIINGYFYDASFIGIWSEIIIRNCTFSGNSGGDVSNIYSVLTINNTLFENSKLFGNNEGVLRLYINTRTEISNSIFRGVSVNSKITKCAYIFAALNDQLKIINCKIIGNFDPVQGIYAEIVNELFIESSYITQLNPIFYSAVTAISVRKLIMINLKITKNESKYNGGGVFLENTNFTVKNTEISFNKAQDSGGGLYFAAPTCNYCGIYILKNTTIYNNTCVNGGGGIKWKDFKPEIENEDLIFNNLAAYGSLLASIPAKLGVSPDRRLSDESSISVSNVPPGKMFYGEGNIYIYDTYGQIVTTENSINITISINETKNSNSSVSGSTLFKAKDGVFTISNFTLSGTPGSYIYLKVVSDGMKNNNARNDNTKYKNTFLIHAQFRNCTKGEQIQASACIDCPINKYTIEASQNCLDCPNGATCAGGDTLIVKNGYWRSSLDSDIIYTCIISQACLEGNETSELGSCSAGYSEVLCQSCEKGYSKALDGKCSKCPRGEINAIIILALVIVIIFASVILVKSTLTSAFSPKSLHSIYMKIFTNFLQLILIVTQFNLDWPTYVIKFYSIHNNAASVSDQLFSLDCYLADAGTLSKSQSYFIKLSFVTGIPLVIFALSYIYWTFHGYLLSSYKYLKREVFTTIIVLFFLVYPSIVKILFSSLSCVEIDKMKSYLVTDTAIQCWDSAHKKYTFGIALPGIILWAIGFPTLLLLIMYKKRRRLHLDDNKVIYGFLFNGYKLSKFYWEFIIMYRKILLIKISVFMASLPSIFQALNIIIVLFASLYLQYSKKPYTSKELNSMEMQSIFIATITIYSGLYYLSESINEEIKVFLFILMVLTNLYFVLYWLYYMTLVLIDKFILFFPQFRLKFKRGDTFEDDFNKEEIVQDGVFFNKIEGEKAYTFFNKENLQEENQEQVNYVNMDQVYLDVAKESIKKHYKKNKWKY